jgi:Ca-activated chloride channel homolog
MRLAFSAIVIRLGMGSAVRISCTLLIGVVATVLAGTAMGGSPPGDSEGPVSPITARRTHSPFEGASGFHLNVNRVLIPVTVTDDLNRPVSGLQAKDFRVFEDGIEQKVDRVSIEDAPISVGLVFDASSSMKSKMQPARKAVSELLRTALPEDEFFLVRFSDAPERAFGFTKQAKSIEDSLTATRADGWTALWDAMYFSMHEMKNASHVRRALVVLSDGVDNASRYNKRSVHDVALESDLRIFSICIQERSRGLADIAEATGGRALLVRRLAELPEAAEVISAELHSEYVVDYSSTNRQNDGRYRSVLIRVVQPLGSPRFHVSWRRGYYAAE